MTSIKVIEAAPKYLFSRLAAFEVILNSYTEFEKKYILNKGQLNKFDKSIVNMVFRAADDLIVDLRDFYFKNTPMNQFVTQKHVVFVLSNELETLTSNKNDGVKLEMLVKIKKELMEYMI